MNKWGYGVSRSLELAGTVLGVAPDELLDRSKKELLRQVQDWEKDKDDALLYESEGYIYNNLHSWLFGISRHSTVTTCKELDAHGYSPQTIVDYGGGLGFSACLLAAHYPKSKVVFWEPSTTESSFCRELVKASGTENVVVSEKPVSGEVLLCIGVLEYTARPDAFLCDVMSNDVTILSLEVGGSPRWPGHQLYYTMSTGEIVPNRFLRRWGAREAGKRGLFPIAKRVYHYNNCPSVYARPGLLGVPQFLPGAERGSK